MRHILEYLLKRQLRKLLKNNSPKIVAVVGSVGKTSTKLAIARMLNESYPVCYQEGNYNVALTIPLVFFEESLPDSLRDIVAWCKLLVRVYKKARKPFAYDWVVVELGIDKPGEMQKLAAIFGRKLDIAVVTAISYEHMAAFESIGQVAEEELKILGVAEKGIVSYDSVPNEYYKNTANIELFGIKGGDVRVIPERFGDTGYDITIASKEQTFRAHTMLIGEHNVQAIAAAVAVGQEAGMDQTAMISAIKQIKPFAGRMNVLSGKSGSVIIDDSYNASPEAVIRALDTLYRMPQKNKIVLIGNMNELGKFSEESHRKIGKYCDPSKLHLVVTLGVDANKFCAEEALANGCKVITSNSPYEAGEIIANQLSNDTVVLIKGSQNGVFAEEAIKSLLANDEDCSKLVRQSEFWLAKKRQQFSDAPQAQQV